MNLAIQKLQQLVKETEVKLDHARVAHEAHVRTAAESSAQVVALTALLADLKSALIALPVAGLKVVEAVPAAATPAPAPKAEKAAKR